MIRSCEVINFHPYVEDDDFDRQKGLCLSNKQFNNRMRVKTPWNDDLDLRFSERSLKTSNYETLLEHLGPWLKLTGAVFKTYRTKLLPSQGSERSARNANSTTPLTVVSLMHRTLSSSHPTTRFKSAGRVAVVPRCRNNKSPVNTT